VRCEIVEGMALQQNADDSKAVADCLQGVSLSPQSAFAEYAMADVLYNHGKFQDSLTDYNKAVALGLTDRGVYWRRCDAFRRVGNLDAALSDCQKQVTLTPGDINALYTLGRSTSHVRTTRPRLPT